jgi:uncharacterized protein involved in response to NO
MPRLTPKPYTGPALFSYGFRPFFLLAALFALLAIPVWLMLRAGDLTLQGPFAPRDWHLHEMLFGYTSAVIVGFLFTAIPNWTGRMPTRGPALMLLAALWVAGRLAVAGLLGLGAVGVLLLDAGFLAAVLALTAREIIAGRNWRNLMVVGPVGLYLAANITFHLEVMARGESLYGTRASLAVVIFLITLIGGRIIPSFTRNWLVKRQQTRLPVPFNRFDALCLATGAVALILWAARPEGIVTAAALATAAGLHALRLLRWRGLASWRSPLLLMLHLAYAFVPLGMAAQTLAAWGMAAPAAGAHLWGIGAVGGMTLAVMMRAAMGHTGRVLEAGVGLSAGFAALLIAGLLRVLLPEAHLAGQSGLVWAAFFWSLAFALYLWRVGPWLWQPNPSARRPNR